MRRAIPVLLCLIALALFCSCNTTKESETMATTADRNITIVNSVHEADIWVLPDTEANRKTTLWGTATAGKVSTDEARQAGIDKPGDNGQYLFRMIDTDKWYYSSENLVLEEGWTLEIKQESKHVYVIEVADKDGTLKASYEVFAARL